MTWLCIDDGSDGTSLPATARLSQFPTSAVCITATNAAPRNARTITNWARVSGTAQRLRARHLLVVSRTGFNGSRTAPP
jgi:hypothetical protein